MKSSSGKILSLIRRSLALSNFLRIWQTFVPQFICLFVLRSDEAGSKKNCTEFEMRQNK